MNSDQLKNYVIVSLATALFVIALVWVRDSNATGAVSAPSQSGLSADGY